MDLKTLSLSMTQNSIKYNNCAKHFFENKYCKMLNLAINNNNSFNLFYDDLFKELTDNKFANNNYCKNKDEFKNYIKMNANKILKPNQIISCKMVYDDCDSSFYTYKINDANNCEIKISLNISSKINNLSNEIIKYVDLNDNTIYKNAKFKMIMDDENITIDNECNNGDSLNGDVNKF